MVFALNSCTGNDTERKPAAQNTDAEAADQNSQTGLTVANLDPLVEAGLKAFNFQALKTPIALPDFALADLSGTMVRIESFRGKWVLLNFWATWCPPCRAEMPGMNELQKAFGGSTFTFVAIDSQEEPSKVKEFIEREQYTMPVLLDVDGNVSATFGINSLPTTFLVDPQGIVQGGMIGSQHYDTPEARAFLGSISR